MTTHVELRRGAYHDSVSLMQVSRAVAGTAGVTAAQVAMATELNVDVLRGMGFDVPAEAGPNDLVVALRTESEDGVEAALAAVADALAGLVGQALAPDLVIPSPFDPRVGPAVASAVAEAARRAGVARR